MKNTRIIASVPHAHGARSRAFVRADQIATAENSARMSVQKSSDPDCPPQNAANTYTFGMFALVFDATYLSEKSCVNSAVHRPSDASTIIAVVAYRPRRPLVTRSSRPSEPPANDVTPDHAAMSSATHNDSSPTRITPSPPPCSPASACTSPH